LRDDTTDEEIKKVLEAKDMMMDAMGVYQHHDAVSGTENQHVANDYVGILNKAMIINN